MVYDVLYDDHKGNLGQARIETDLKDYDRIAQAFELSRKVSVLQVTKVQ